MNDLKFNINLAPQIFQSQTVAALKESLTCFIGAKSDEPVAILLCYSDAYPRPLRVDGPEFLVRSGNGVAVRSYREMSPESRGRLADPVLHLEDDELFHRSIQQIISEMRHGEDGSYYHLIITEDAVIFLRLDTASSWNTKWSGERFACFCQLLCRKAVSVHEAIVRHQHLQALIRLYHACIAVFDPHTTLALPPLLPPTVSDLLPYLERA